MRLSACVITKNEEKNITKWLEEMSEIADEMIVVDTGSTDNTVDIAEKAGAKVFHFQWIDDFSAAKNYAIEQAKGDWIAFLDADEYFTPASKKQVRQSVRRFHADKKIGSIMCLLTNIDKDNRNKIIDSMLQVRLFRNIPTIRYKGKIHENLFNAGKEMGMAFCKDLEIHHTGYSRSIVKQKSERNLKIIHAKLEQEGETLEVIAQLMDAYNASGRYEDAVKYARMGIARQLKTIGMTGHPHEILISSLSRLVGQNGHTLEELYDAIDDAMETYPEEAVFPLEKGYILWQHHGYLQAEKYLLDGMRLRKVFEEQFANGYGMNDVSRRMVHMGYEALGNIAWLKGNVRQAAEYFTEGLRYYKYNVGLLQGLCKCLKGADPVDVIQVICQYYDKEIDADFIESALGNSVDMRVILFFHNVVEKKSINTHNTNNNSEIVKYLLTKNYNSAAVVAAGALTECYNIMTASDKILRKSNYQNQNNDNIIAAVLPQKYSKILYDDSEYNAEYAAVERMMKIAGSKLQDTAEIPLVSIMIPTYNRPKMFEEALKSALAQTYPNVEIIVNDNSTNDDTEVLIQKYLGDYRLRYYRNKAAKTKEENFKPFEKQARGSLLQWCMDDDILAPNKLAVMVQVLRDNPKITLVTSQRGFINENGEYIPSRYEHDIEINGTFGYVEGPVLANYIITNYRNIIGEPSAVLFRRNDLQYHYWRAESKGLKTISDLAMWLELLEKGDAVIFKEPLSYYRVHAQQEGKIPEVCLLSRLEWIKLLNEYRSRGIFINNEKIYINGLKNLYNDYKGFYLNSKELQEAQNHKEYELAMHEIKAYLDSCAKN